MSSNLYAQKVASEHPLILWPLDDQADYLSYLSDNERNFKNWSFSSQFIVDNTVKKDIVNTAPFPSSPISRIINNKKRTSFSISLDNVYSHSSLNYDLWTISMGLWVYLDFTPSNTTVSMAYTYGEIKNEKTFLIEQGNSWVFLSAIFPYPDYYNSVDQSIDFYVDVKGLPVSGSVKSFYFNGLSFGQWAEEYNTQSLGTMVYQGSSFGTSDIIRPQNSVQYLPQSLQNTSVIKALPYGYESQDAIDIVNKQEDLAFYIIEQNKLLARNASMPMVFGSSSITTISPSPTLGPSFIFPGKGFLNASGKKKTATFEMWLRVNPDTVTAKRIFGPVASDDGIYIEGPFISIKVGKYTGSHYIGEWYRPMLVQFKYREDAAILSINGQEVIFLTFDQDPITEEYGITFPEEYVNGYRNDMLAFYAYPDIPQIDIDCLGIYPYDVPNIVAKRRWVYGQAVEFPETINASYGGSSAVIDYQFANYLNNYNYPSIGKWVQGINENTSIVNGSLCSPSYEAPSAFFDINTESDWYAAMSTRGINNITLKPTDSWSDVNGYLYFDNFNKLNKLIYGIYGIFEIPENFSGTQTIFKIEDDLTENYFKVEIFKSGSDIKTRYLFYFNGILSTIYTSINSLSTGTEVNIGFEIPKIIQQFGNGLQSFFGNTSRLRLYVGGDKTFTNTFSGRIVTMSICSANSFKDVSSLFTSDGVIDSKDILYDGGTPTTIVWDFIADGGKPATIHTFNPNEYYDPVIIYDGGTPTTTVWDSIIDGDIPAETVYDGGSYNTNSWSSTLDGGTPTPPTSWENIIDANTANQLGSYIDGGYVDNSGESTYSVVLSDNVSTYTLIPKIDFNTFRIKVGAKSYWEDYIPLSLLAKNTDDGYQVDFIQFNIDYPKPLFSQNNYRNTNNSLLKMYVTFQYIDDQNTRKSLSYFTNTQFANSEDIVVPGNDWEYTKYEVTDHTILYPPKLSQYDNIAISTHLEFISKDVEKQAIRLKSLELASKVLDSNKESEIGTKFGKSLMMYELVNNLVPEITTNKACAISKKSTPYIYLTRNSGIKTLAGLNANEDAGFYFPINETLDSSYKLGSMMLSIRFENTFSIEPIPIFELNYLTDKIIFYAQTVNPSGTRAKIYAKKGNDTYSNIYFFINGVKTPNPTININEWNMLSFAFATPLSMASYSGKFKIKYPMVVHQISAYQNVDNVNGNAIDLGLSNYYGISASELHGSYMGRNVISINDKSTLMLYNFTRSYYQNVSVTTKTVNPA
jgi:hypothetical protein